MKINELIKLIDAFQDDADVQSFDLTTKEGYEKFKNVIQELRDTDTSLFDVFGIDINEWLDNVANLGKNIYDKVNKDSENYKETSKNNKQIKREVIDHSEEDEDDDYKGEDTKNVKVKEQEFKRPSELLTINQKLQLHKLVQEYVDTTIKPYNKGVLTNEQVNDAYAGLYEFGAWILNK